MFETGVTILIISLWVLFAFLSFRVLNNLAAKNLNGRKWQVLALTIPLSLFIGYYSAIFYIVVIAWLLLLLL
jgi:hypothetical protein